MSAHEDLATRSGKPQFPQYWNAQNNSSYRPCKNLRMDTIPKLQIQIKTVEKKKIEKIVLPQCLAQTYPTSLSSIKTPANDKLSAQHCPITESATKTPENDKLPAQHCPAKESATKTSTP